MPYIRRLPSGKHQATVRRADGTRLTRTDPLRRVVAAWAKETEAAIARGSWRDPRVNKVTVGQWHDRWSAARIVEPETARGDDGVWRIHIQPFLADRPLVDLTRVEVQAWMRARRDAGAGAQVIRRAFNYLRSMLEAAVLEQLIPANPCRGLRPPPTPPRQPDWFTRAEVDVLLEVLDEPHATMTALMCWVGPRWGEAAALRGTDVDWLRNRIRVERVMTQAGREKAYPKTSASRRESPVPGWLMDRMSRLMEGRDRGELVFTTRRGGRPLSAANWRRTWTEAFTDLKVAGERPGEWVPVRYRPPHTCRHTAASWLVQEGVPLYDVQRQLGHSSFAVTQRYAHLAPDAHDAVTGAWRRIGEPGDAPATHEGAGQG